AERGDFDARITEVLRAVEELRQMDAATREGAEYVKIDVRRWRGAVAAIRDVLAARRASKTEGLRSRLARLSIPAEVEQRFEALLGRSDFQTLEEYLDRLERGEPLPALETEQAAL